MSKKLDTDVCLRELKRSFSSLDIKDIYGKLNYDVVVVACSDFLKSLDYKVINKPIDRNVKTIDGLVNLFYDLKSFNHAGNKCELVSSPKRDLAVFSRFVSARQTELNCTKQQAIADCVFIIKSLFYYEEQLGLNEAVGVWVFGTDKCKWITDRVIRLANKDKEMENSYAVERLVDRYDQDHEDEFKGLLERTKGDKYGR